MGGFPLPVEALLKKHPKRQLLKHAQVREKVRGTEVSDAIGCIRCSPPTRAAGMRRTGLLLLFHGIKFGNPQKLNLRREKRR